MSGEYFPPPSTNIPFRFTETGYEAPTGAMLFNFAPLGAASSLGAAIQVMQLYHDAAYTYLKYCPKYVVGYAAGRVQILKGRCTYGGIRDLQTLITGEEREFASGDLGALIDGIYATGQEDLPASLNAVPPSDLQGIIGVHNPENITAQINGEYPQGSGDLPAEIGIHSPKDLTAYLKVRSTDQDDLPATIDGVKRSGTSDLPATIDTHSPGDINGYIGVHTPEDLPATIDGVKRRGQGDLGSIIDIHLPQDLSAEIGIHSPGNLIAAIRSRIEAFDDLPASIYGLQTGDLSALIGMHSAENLGARISGGGVGIVDLPAYLTGIKRRGSGDLSANISIHLPEDLGASARGVKSDIEDLTGSIRGLVETYLTANISIHSPENLRSTIRGWGTGNVSLPAVVRGWRSEIQENLSAEIGMHPPQNLTAEIGMHPPVDLQAAIGAHPWEQLWMIIRAWNRNNQRDLLASIMGWQADDLQGIIGGHNPGNIFGVIRPWIREVSDDLQSSVHSWELSPLLYSEIDIHDPRDIKFFIKGWAREVPDYLSAFVHSYEIRYLSAQIDIHPFESILSSIRPWHRNLYDDLPTLIKGWQYDNIGGSIGMHMWQNITARVTVHPPPPIYASIRGWIREIQEDLPAYIRGWQDGNLSADIGAHAAGNLGIILRSWALEVPEDLPALIHGWQELDLAGIVTGTHLPRDLGIILRSWALEVPEDLPAYIHGWQELDLGVITKGGHLPGNIIAHIRIFQTEFLDITASIHGWIEQYISAEIGMHSPENLRGIIRPWYSDFRNLVAYIHGWQELDLGATIDTHLPSDLRGVILVLESTSRDLLAHIKSYEFRDFGVITKGGHLPGNLTAALFAEQVTSGNLNALIHAWHIIDLSANIRAVRTRDISAQLYIIPPEDLSAYLKARLIRNLTGSVYGWAYSDLGSTINSIFSTDITASVDGRTDMYGDLGVLLKSIGSGYSDLSVFIRCILQRPLGAIIRATYLADMLAYVFPIQPEPLQGIIHGWDTIDLQAILNGQDYPWNLTASINGSGYYRNLAAFIDSSMQVGVAGNLSSSAHGWERRDFPAYIGADTAPYLSAYLNPLLYSGDLHASIRPKMIRLTTVISIITMEHLDLSSTINVSCFGTGYSNLQASVWAKYKSDLFAYIRPTIYDYKPSLLGAKTGYASEYTEVDYLRINVTVYPTEYYTEDKLKINFYIAGVENLLSAYVRGTLRYTDFNASITAEQPVSHVYENTLKNRERVISTTYDGVFTSFQTVEFSFKSMVSDYYYSSDGDYAWKIDRLERWILDVKSYLPANTVLNLKRRLHKSTVLYSLNKFNSIDEAMKHAIAYVTEYPQANLSATIYNVGTYESLGGTINPRYTRSSNSMLSTAITPTGMTVIIGTTDGDFEKI